MSSLHTSSYMAMGYSLHNRVKLVRGGKPYFDLLLQLIEQAQSSLHLQTYIYGHDETAHAVTQALIAAAARGVKVFMVLDGYGSQTLGKPFLQQMKMNGIHFRWFEPLLGSKKFYVGRRLHHKVVVADGWYSLVGGVNISNKYNDLPHQPAWLDWALYTEGEASLQLHQICMDIWNKSNWKPGLKKQFLPPPAVALPEESCLVRIRRNDWVRRRLQITRSYLEMFRQAQSHVIIMSSYFLPGRSFRNAMQAAIKRGVTIEVIAAGKSDIAMAKQAERYLYNWLLRHHIRMYEYQPHILHGKLSCYDGKWITIGSYNVNDLSTFASIELNMEVLHPEFAGLVEIQLRDIMQQHCQEVTMADFAAANHWIKRIWQRLNYDMVRLLFFLFTFNFKQKPPGKKASE